MKKIRNTNPKQLANLRPVQKGEVRNPLGRPKGARDALSQQFLTALKNDFEAHGARAIVDARESDPVAYVKVVAALVPREMNLNMKGSVFDTMSDQEITHFLDACSRARSEGSVIEADCEEVIPEIH